LSGGFSSVRNVKAWAGAAATAAMNVTAMRSCMVRISPLSSTPMIASARSGGVVPMPRTSQVHHAPGRCARFTHRGTHGTIPSIMDAPGTTYVLEATPRPPRRLARLAELANIRWYSWDRPTRALFARLHPHLWDAVGHNPKALLKRIDEQRLVDAADDPVFLNNFN